MERTLIKHLIKQVKQQQKDKQWRKNNFITTEQFFKLNINHKNKRNGTQI